jgi:hypothetical protein
VDGKGRYARPRCFAVRWFRQRGPRDRPAILRPHPGKRPAGHSQKMMAPSRVPGSQAICAPFFPREMALACTEVSVRPTRTFDSHFWIAPPTRSLRASHQEASKAAQIRVSRRRLSISAAAVLSRSISPAHLLEMGSWIESVRRVKCPWTQLLGALRSWSHAALSPHYSLTV